MHPLTETLCAIATPPGQGGVGIVRLSGPKAFEIATLIFKGTRPLQKERALRFGTFRDPATNEILDEGLLLVMPGPQSYTAEDVVEFHAHGSPALVEKIVDVLVQQGALAAHPGEFTYRAVMNGRLDLTQAEAVEALVGAQGDAARREALRQLTGGLAVQLEPLEEKIKDLYLQIEARLEFPEEGVPSLDHEEVEGKIHQIQRELVRLLESYRQGKVLKEGLKVALVGPPNTGKSSLFNALLGADRAIVTPHPGTTRDVVEGEILLKGTRVRLYDTAGLREAEHEVEAEGIRRSRMIIEEADMVLWLLDAGSPEASLEEAKRISLPESRTWYVFNKTDCLAQPESWKSASAGLFPSRCLPLSCKTGEGVDEVLEVMEEAIERTLPGEAVVLMSARHRGEAAEAHRHLERLERLIHGRQPLELWAEEVKQAALAIGRIRGRRLPEAAFEEIFQRFCIGK